jgi:uncharacterized iron-regulated protein
LIFADIYKFGILFAALALLFGGSVPAIAQQIDRPGLQATCDRQGILTQLSRANVVYLAETHDSKADHQAQLELIQALYSQNSKIAIGLEMFQRPFQGVLDQYLAGQLTEVDLLVQSQYTQRWGFSWQFYAPILRFAKQHQLHLIALNTPTEVTRKVGQVGLKGLAPDDLKFIPPLKDIDISNTVYREQARQIYQQFHQGTSASDNFEHFFQAQVLWDETMAAAIAEFLKKYPDHKVIVLAGKGHIADGHGIPDRVARRLQAAIPDFNQHSVWLNPDPADTSLSASTANSFWSQAACRQGGN